MAVEVEMNGKDCKESSAIGVDSQLPIRLYYLRSTIFLPLTLSAFICNR